MAKRTPTPPTTVDNMLRLINKRIDTAVKSLGKASALYQKLASQIKEQLPKSKYVKTDKNGVVSISRSKEAKEKLNINKIISLYNVALKNTVKAEKDKIKEYMKQLSEPHEAEPKNPKEKIKYYAAYLAELSDQYSDDIVFLYDYEGYEEVAQIMATIIRASGRRTYAEIEKVHSMAEKYRKNNLPPLPALPSFIDDAFAELNEGFENIDFM